MTQEPKYKQFTVRVPMEHVDKIIETTNRMKHISCTQDALGELLVMGVEKQDNILFGNFDDLSDDEKIMSMHIKLSYLKYLRNRLKAILSNEDMLLDKEIDDIKQSAARLGVDIDDLMDGKKVSVQTRIYITEVRTQKEKAKQFLESVFVSGVCLPVQQVKVMAEEKGIEEFTLNKVKRILGIVSKRDGKNWMWYKPDEKQPEETRKQEEVEEGDSYLIESPCSFVETFGLLEEEIIPY